MPGVRVTDAVARKRLLDRGIILLSEKFEGTKHEYEFRCVDKGHIWVGSGKKVSPTGGGCPKCAREARKYTIEEINEIFSNKNLGIEFIDDFYIDSGYKHLLRCKKGHEWKAPVNSILSSGHGCRICENEKISLKGDDIDRRLQEKDIRVYYKKYSGTHSRYNFKCLKCDFQWKTTLNNVLHHSGCPNCSRERTESLMASKIKSFCKKEFDFVSEEESLIKNPSTGRDLRYDIVIYDYSSPIFIEINGQQHYRYIEFFHGNPENYRYRRRVNAIKKNYALENGIYIEIDITKFDFNSAKMEILSRIGGAF